MAGKMRKRKETATEGRMAIESDVLVIGGGLAGLTAALSASEEGSHVRLLSYKQSTLRNASGLIDILGYAPDGERPLTDPYAVIPDLPEDHPYRTVGVERIREAMGLFDDAVPAYSGEHTKRNALVTTHVGTVKPTARYPASMTAALASDDRGMLLVGFDSLVDFDAPLAAATLQKSGVPFSVRGVTVEFPGNLRADAKITRYAKLLESDETTRKRLAAAVQSHLDGEPRVGFPAVLGDTQTERVREELADALGTAVFEVPMSPPSLPGIRLEERLFSALSETGASIETGNPVVAYDGSDGGGTGNDGSSGSDRIECVSVEKNGAKIPYSAEEYVLATGGLVGKGVNSNRERVYEPIFDCPIQRSENRYDWFDDAVFGDHPFARFGVHTDETLRPVDHRENVVFENLRAAGSVLGGYDFAAEKSGSGVSIATGYMAGMTAAQEAL